MNGVHIREWRDDDAEGVAALTHRFFAPDPPWTAEIARGELNADALGNGAQVRVAVAGGTVVGVAGWVTGPPWIYLWPLTSADAEVAGALMDAVLAAAAAPGLERATVSVRACEPAKREAVARRGMAHAMDWLFLSRHVTAAPPVSALPRGLRWVTGAGIDRDALLETYNAAFADVPLTAPATPADIDRMLDGPTAWPDGTCVLAGADGGCAAFLIGATAPDHQVVEGIGTAPAWRRHGLGRVLLGRAMGALAASGGGELRAVIAGTNAASLGLHLAEGFTEHARKEVWEMPLT